MPNKFNGIQWPLARAKEITKNRSDWNLASRSYSVAKFSVRLAEAAVENQWCGRVACHCSHLVSWLAGTDRFDGAGTGVVVPTRHLWSSLWPSAKVKLAQPVCEKAGHEEKL